MKSFLYLLLFVAPIAALVWLFSKVDWLVEHELVMWLAMAVFCGLFWWWDTWKNRITEEDARKGLEELLTAPRGKAQTLRAAHPRKE